MKRVCLLACCCVVLSGCMHAAPVEVKQPTPQKLELTVTNVEKELVKGKSTREDLVAKFGPPNSVVRNPNYVPKLNVPGMKLTIPPAMMVAAVMPLPEGLSELAEVRQEAVDRLLRSADRHRRSPARRSGTSATAGEGEP